MTHVVLSNLTGLSPLRIGDRTYDVSRGSLNILNEQGTVIKSTAIPVDEMTPDWRQQVDDKWTSYLGKTSDGVLSQDHSWYKVFDETHQRILASNQMMPGWVMAADLEGAVQWLTLTGPECCNFACVIGSEDRIFHGSSCGRRLTILAKDGTLLSKTVMPEEWWPYMFISDGNQGVCFLTAKLLVRYDASGKLTWKEPHQLAVQSEHSSADISQLIRQGRASK